jgi:hypothetical protein
MLGFAATSTLFVRLVLPQRHYLWCAFLRRLNDGQMCAHPPTPDNDTSEVNNDHQFDRMSEFWWDHKNNNSMILGLQSSPPHGWQPCCWGLNGTKTCSCSNEACELSWTSAAVRNRIVRGPIPVFS